MICQQSFTDISDFIEYNYLIGTLTFEEMKAMQGFNRLIRMTSTSMKTMIENIEKESIEKKGN